MIFTKEGYILNELYKNYFSFYCTWYLVDILSKIEKALNAGINEKDIHAIHEYIKKCYE